MNSKCGVQSKKRYESHESCVCIVGFSACGCQKKSVVYETECRHVERDTKEREREIRRTRAGCPLSPKLPVHFDAFIPAKPQRPTFRFNYSSTCPYMHLFINLPVHFDTFIPTNRYGLPVHFATALHIHSSTCSPMYLFSLIFPSGKIFTVTCQLIYWSTYPPTYPKINQPVYLDGFSSG